MDDLEINALVTRLSRPHPSGGVVIERAAILAAGADFPAVMNCASFCRLARCTDRGRPL